MPRVHFCILPIVLCIINWGSLVPLSEVSGQEIAGHSMTPAVANGNSLSAAEKYSTPPPPSTSGRSSVPPKKMDDAELTGQGEMINNSNHQSSVDQEEDIERDIMEEALVLLNESHTYWVNGNLEDALEMLDQAYALLLDTNGNPDVARQKDDLRLMISKRILSIYNSNQTTAKGKRSEVPVVTNADVEKEIRQFQTVERDFFISSYQRSAMYRPIMLRELKKAGLPEELAWLPLVESGFKISALSSARALGLWQFIPSTGYKYGLNRDDWVDERMDIEKSTRAAIDYLKELHNMFGDWLTVLAAYNCGEGRIMRTIAAQHINYLDRFWDLYHQLPYETARYVPRFLATLLIIKDPQKYGMDLEAGYGKGTALSYEIVEVNKSMRLQDIAQKLETPEEIINVLNAELRHKITPDRPYNLKVPTQMAEQLLKVIDDVPQCEKPYATSRIPGINIQHKVRQGETLVTIARKYKTSVSTIRTSNHLSKKEDVTAGQRLTIPIKGTRGGTDKGHKSEKSMKYRVQKGDTLASLAKKNDVTVSEIRKTNRLENDTLKIGQTLRIERDNDEGNQDQKKDIREEKAGKVRAAAKKNTTGRANESSEIRKYTVRKGDNLIKIARENNMTPENLRQLNSIASKDKIRPGQVLLIK
jgi:membrane-bound lytic murein transglycosylase D